MRRRQRRLNRPKKPQLRHSPNRRHSFERNRR
jgi:hypothetical protein